MTANQTQHTPGPWILGEYDECLGYLCMTGGVRAGPVVLDAADYGQDRCGVFTEKQRQHMMADAALIAAAPDMLAALEYALPVLEEALKSAKDMALDVYAIKDARQRLEAARAAIAATKDRKAGGAQS